MTWYTVSWTIDTEADDPVEAAKQAQAMLQSEIVDWVYEVTDCSTGEKIKVDLELERLEEEYKDDDNDDAGNCCCYR